jgi:hypothetical protein
VKIDIRPAFDESVMASELPVRKAAAKMLKQLQALNLNQLWNHPGLNFEKLHGGEQLYSLRVTGSVRAVTCLLKGPIIELVSLHTQHDKAYRK